MGIESSIGLTATTSVTLTADNTAVDPAGYGVILIGSDNATPANRTFTLTASAAVGHKLTLIWTAQAGEMADTGIQKLSAAWSPGVYDSISLISDGTNWIETGRSANA